jgi:glycosyltransferase involved in cell wall biosynthesis
LNVVYDLLGFQSRDHGERGIARYVLHLALALERTHSGLITQYLVDPRLPLPAGAEPLIATGRVVRYEGDDPVRRPGAGGVFVAGSLFEMDESLDRVLPTWARAPQWRTAAVLYDLIPAKFKDWYLQRADVRNVYLSRAAALSSIDQLLAISQASADDASSLLGVAPERLTVIGAGADARFRRPDTDHHEVARQLVARGEVPGLRPGYVLFPSGIERRKNIERTIEAYGQLDPATRARHQLVLVCRLDEYADELLTRVCGQAGVTGEVLTTGFVTDDTLCRLNQGAELVIFPSIYEGFGLPVLEAMQCGAPVICADSSSLTEIQTWPEARFDPGSTDAVARALRDTLANPELLERLRHQELPPFTWDRAAELTAGAIARMAQEGRRRATVNRPDQPRLAVVTPLPPQRSGIATYAYRLLEGLRHHCDVTVFVDEGVEECVGGVVAPDGVSIAPLTHLEPTIRAGGAFDRILYFMGNSRFHVDMLEALRRQPGWVLLHDVRLTGLYSEIHRLSPDRLVDHSVGATLAELYPGRYRESLEAMESIPPHEAHRFGVWLTREVQDLAQQVLVHSSFGASVVALDTGSAVQVIYPLPCPTVGADPDPDPAPVRERPVIASFGIVSPVKQPEVLVSAMPLVLAAVPAARLVFAGEVEDHHRAELESQADELGVADCLEFTGHLDDDGFARAQESAAVAVQLRAITNGESSAAVAELLSLGVPTVVTELGAMTELPDDAVVKVDRAVTGHDLAAVLIDLLTDPDRRDSLREGAQAYARANSFSQAAAVLAKVLFA